MMDQATDSTARRFSAAADRVGIWIVGVSAVLVAALHVIGVVLGGRQALGAGPVEVTGMSLGNASTPPFTESLTAVTEARYESVALTVEGAPSAARWLLWGAEAVSSFAAIGICLALVWLCVRVARRRPFGRSLTAALLVTASLVMVGGMFGQVLAAMGRAEIVDHLGMESTAGDHGAGIIEGLAGFHLNLSLTPLGIGLALGVVAAAFEIGARLQQDTEGLV